MKFNDEQSRVAVNLRQYYEVWAQARRELYRLNYRLYWKVSGHREYLVKLVNSRNDGKSLGARSAETERLMLEYERDKCSAQERAAGVELTLRTTARIYRTLRLPAIASEAAAILRSADERGMLDSDFIIVGTTAMAAYEIEAAARFALGMDATEDFDLAWSDPGRATVASRSRVAPIMSMLKSVDSTYVVNTERPFQARNAKAYEVEVLMAPSVASAYPPSEPLRPIALPEQEWLLRGNRVDHVVCGRDGSPARLVVPDPRWYALHKLWLGTQAKRNPLKREKDLKQGRALFAAIRDAMPQFPLDAGFAAEVPSELKPMYKAQLAL
ncbi:MAG: GSU2403 family nucleotidyltransferase fold protein [Betaproteobacteria bacterium]